MIALAKIGALGLLPRLARVVHVTPQVVREVAKRGEPAAPALDALLEEGRCVVVEDPGPDDEAGDLGLGPGESSLFAAYRPGDRLVLDDRGARALARARGIPHSGLLGLLVAGVQAGRLSTDEGLGVLSALVASDFRLTVDLYEWAARRIRAAGDRGERTP